LWVAFLASRSGLFAGLFVGAVRFAHLNVLFNLLIPKQCAGESSLRLPLWGRWGKGNKLPDLPKLPKCTHATLEVGVRLAGEL